MTTTRTPLLLLTALLAGIVVGLIIADYLRPQPAPEPRDPKPPAGKFYDAGKIIDLDVAV